MEVLIEDETSRLQSVILGIAESLGGTPQVEETYDPRSRESILKGIYPIEIDLMAQMEGFASVLKKHQVKIFRPDLLPNTNQVYTRDIGFVIGDRFVLPNVIEDRAYEKQGLNTLLTQIAPEKLVVMPKGIRAEGGDVIVWKNKLYVGFSEKEDFDEFYVSRTNRGGLEFLKETFPNYEVHGFELMKSDLDPRLSALHLDCCFQPIGSDQCIICEAGFKNKNDFDRLVSHFGASKCTFISKEEMYLMFTNVFSIAPDLVVSEKSFHRLNEVLLSRGFRVETIAYNEICKMGGLLRCSTMPLYRSK